MYLSYSTFSLSASWTFFACISSRPGQCGRADGYILEGEELAFYKRQLAQKKSK